MSGGTLRCMWSWCQPYYHVTLCYEHRNFIWTHAWTSVGVAYARDYSHPGALEQQLLRKKNISGQCRCRLSCDVSAPTFFSSEILPKAQFQDMNLHNPLHPTSIYTSLFKVMNSTEATVLYLGILRAARALATFYEERNATVNNALRNAYKHKFWTRWGPDTLKSIRYTVRLETHKKKNMKLSLTYFYPCSPFMATFSPSIMLRPLRAIIASITSQPLPLREQLRKTERLTFLLSETITAATWS